ncbi:HNH endonuclease [Acidiluteibacter ferrifornacis]|uniref:HNH endonuclease 5 domain-containing protein n=1 Tax=Acidiluteibacter ferrifornacis TaxID=2692424 RepID=A0A6N9NHR1_9FLAO|nr:HNH endonuclease [Acidiluteibacter ferrifornacis]NBG66208.1 hypothetical protein [Acidiluteibacter ferrifornacis]
MKNKCFVCPLRNQSEECEHSFEDGKGSEEHILLQSLGGKLKSKRLLCDKSNKEFGKKYDLEVSDQLKLIKDIMGINTRTKIKSIDLVDLEGRLRPIKAGSYKPMHTIDLVKDNGIITLSFKNDEEFDKKRKELINSGKYKEERPVIESKFLRQFSNKYSEGEYLTFQINKDYLLHFLKVAIEFYLYCGYPIHNIEGSIRNLEKEIVTDGKNPRVFEYHPEHDVYVPKGNEISHLIHLRVDGKKHLIYCMIEYFNFTRTIVILNDNYNGDINEFKNYCYDLQNKKQLELSKNEIDLGFNNFNLREFRKYYSEKNSIVHNARFNNLWEKIGADLVSKGLIERMSDIIPINNKIG